MAPTAQTEIEARISLCQRIRRHMRDYDLLNTLIKGEEHSDRLIWDAIEIVLDDFNINPPPVGSFFVADFPSLKILQDGVISQLLQSVALLYLRNELTYDHGGTVVSFEQGKTYLQLSQMMWQQYEMGRDKLKESINAQQAVAAAGGVYSSFRLTFRPAWGTFPFSSQSISQ